jgi:hypothetical protein
VADIFPFQRKHMLVFLHLPSQYFTLIGPFTKSELQPLRTHFKDALWGSLHTDQFESYRIDALMELFEDMHLLTGSPDESHQRLLQAIAKGFGIYAKAAGNDLDLDEFCVQMRSVRGPGLAAITPRDTLELWAQTISGDD